MAKLEELDWWPRLLARKDELSLLELAAEFGVSPSAISRALRRNNTNPQSLAPGPSGARRRGARVLTEKQLAPYDQKLGVVPDGRIAKMAGLSTATVARIRRSRGISPAPRTRPVSVLPQATDAFRVTTRSGERWVLLASTLLEASEAASKGGLDAVEIEWVGALIR